MKTYYKGTINYADEIVSINEDLCEGCPYHDYGKISSKIRNSKISQLDYDYRHQMVDEIGLLGRQLNKKGDTLEITDKQIIEFLNIAFQKTSIPVIDDEYEFRIIFELITTEEGEKYAKELHTGLIFPIIQDKNITIKYRMKKTRDYSQFYDKKIILKLEHMPKFEALNKCGCFIQDVQVADNNEVENYLTRFDEGFGRNRRKRIFVETVETSYKKNVFNQEIKQKEIKPVELIEQSRITTLMENIEFLLRKLNKINPILAKEYAEEYESILNAGTEDLTLKPLNIETLAQLETQIELSLMFTKSNNKSISEYLEHLKNQYLENFITDKKEKTKINIDELDKINELFLKSKDEYSALEQRRILKNLSFIYLLEVKENQDEIELERLKNSYFKQNIKSILICIDALIELGFVESDLIIDLNNDISVEGVFEMIRRIEFKKLSKEECMKLILK